MKRLLNVLAGAIVIFAMAASATSCKEPDYKAQIEEKITAFQEFYAGVITDAEMSEDDKDEAVGEKYDLLGQELEQIAREALKKHNDDTLAVYMVMVMEQFELTDGEGIIGLIDQLGPNAQSFDEIQALRSLYDKKSQTAEGTKFVDFAVTQPDGKVKKLSDYAGNGKYCLVDFWASWCGPCRREIPFIADAYKKFAKKGLNVLSVAVWDNPDDSKAAAEELGITWHQIINAQQVPTEIYAIQGIPHVMLIGPDGTILKRDLRGHAIESELEKYL